MTRYVLRVAMWAPVAGMGLAVVLRVAGLVSEAAASQLVALSLGVAFFVFVAASLAQYAAQSYRSASAYAKPLAYTYGGTPAPPPPPKPQWTPMATRVLTHAENLASRDHHIGTEHLLLALFQEPDGVAAAALEGLGLTEADVRAAVRGVLDGTELEAEIDPEPAATT